VVLFRLQKRRRESAELWQALLDKHPTGTMFVAWDNASMPEDEEIEAVVRAAAGRLVLLYLPTSSPWLNPIEMRLPSFPTGSDEIRELFETKRALLAAAHDCFDRFNQCPKKILSVIGSKAAKVA
jgi:putative transposase